MQTFYTYGKWLSATLSSPPEAWSANLDEIIDITKKIPNKIILTSKDPFYSEFQNLP